MKTLFHPKLWLSLCGAFFLFAPLLYCLLAADGHWHRALSDTARAKWRDLTQRELFIAESYEGMWQFFLLGYGVQALAYAWWFSGRTRAVLAILYGGSMICCFMSGVVFASGRYTNIRAGYGNLGIFYCLFLCVLISGAGLGLWEGVDYGNILTTTHFTTGVVLVHHVL